MIETTKAILEKIKSELILLKAHEKDLKQQEQHFKKILKKLERKEEWRVVEFRIN